MEQPKQQEAAQPTPTPERSATSLNLSTAVVEETINNLAECETISGVVEHLLRGFIFARK